MCGEKQLKAPESISVQKERTSQFEGIEDSKRPSTRLRLLWWTGLADLREKRIFLFVAV
jgi:hypothetical protein